MTNLLNKYRHSFYVRFAFLEVNDENCEPCARYNEMLIEIRPHQVSIKSNCEVDDAGDFWAKVEPSRKFPHLTKVAKAASILPDGNAEVERCFPK